MIRTITYFLAFTCVTGCCNKIPVISESIPCNVPKEELQKQCLAPQSIAADAAYGEIIITAIEDRKNLQMCATHDRLVTQAIAACNAAIANHNEEIRAINKKYAKTL